MTEEELQQETDTINKLSHEEMARLWRFAPIGHKYFNGQSPLVKIFKDRFNDLGGMTSQLSKEIGWDQ